MKKTKLFLFILSVFIFGTTVVQAGSVTVDLQVGINAPTVSISASPTNVTSGTASNLTWSSSINATSCTASGAWSGPKATSGTASTGNLTAPSTFVISCSGPGGTAIASASVTITSVPSPTGTLTSSSNSCAIALNANSCLVNLTWATQNPLVTSVITALGMATVSGNSGNNVPFAVPYFSRIFYLYNNVFQLASKTVNSHCAIHTYWNGSVCSADRYTLTLNKIGSGSVSGAGMYNYGKTVTVELNSS